MEFKTLGRQLSRAAGVAGAAGLAVLLAGCSAMTPGNIDEVKPFSEAPRAGTVYLVRGWIGIFSTGIDSLGEKVNQAGVHGMVFQENQWRELAAAIAERYKAAKDPEPLILIGHSYGADDAVSIARELDQENIPVDLIITLDPTTPPNVPRNVRHCVNLYQPNTLDALPFMRGIPLKADEDFAGKLENVNIRADRTDLLDPDLNHFNIEKKEKIHAETIKQILAVCPPRAQWVAARKTAPVIVAARAGAGTGTTQPVVARQPAGTPTKSTSSAASDTRFSNGD